jgi:hypothetical protein
MASEPVLGHWPLITIAGTQRRINVHEANKEKLENQFNSAFRSGHPFGKSRPMEAHDNTVA